MKGNTLKALVIAQYGTLADFTNQFCQKHGKISYTSMRKWLDDPDEVRLCNIKKILSMLNLDGITNTSALLNLDSKM